jgi:hypothetical protein
MKREDSSVFAGCLDETLKVLRTIEYLKAAVVFKKNKESEQFNDVFGWEDSNYTVKDIPNIIRSLKYDSTDGDFVPGTPWGEGDYSGTFPVRHYWQAPSGGGPYEELNITVTPEQFKFDVSHIGFYNNRLSLGPDTYNVHDLSGQFKVVGRTIMRPMYSQRKNLEYWDISKGYKNGEPVYEYVKPVQGVQTLILPGLFRAYKVRLYDRPASTYSSLGCYIKSIGIPKYVTELGDYCFYGAYNLTSVRIESSLKTIPSYCFTWCNNLTHVNIPKSVTTIKNDSFAHSKIANENTLDLSSSELSTIEARAFEYCPMASITFGKNVKSIGIDAFAMCTKLNYIEMECKTPPILETDTTGNAAAFYNVKINGVIRVPSDANRLEWTQWCSSESGPYSHLFERGWKLYFGEEEGRIINASPRMIIYTTTDNQKWPDNKFPLQLGTANFVSNTYSRGIGVAEYDAPILEIPDDLFVYSDTLSGIMLPSQLTTIGHQAFAVCENLKTVTLPSSLVTIEFSAFEECVNLENLVFSNITYSKLRTIEYRAFGSCYKLKNFTLPATVTSLGDSCFVSQDCRAVTLLGNNPPTLGQTVFDSLTYKSGEEYLPASIIVPNPQVYIQAWPDYAQRIM